MDHRSRRRLYSGPTRNRRGRDQLNGNRRADRVATLATQHQGGAALPYAVAIVSPATDPALIEAAQGGDKRALDDLLRLHQPNIYGICRRIAGNDSDALDASQEALMAVVKGLPRFDGRAAFSTWVYRVATNACLDELRRRKRRPTPGLPDLERQSDTSSRTQDPADIVSSRINIDSALASLSEEFRVAVVLRDVVGLDYESIAQILDIAPGTVRSRIARGRRKLASDIGGNQTAPSQRHSNDP